jgi:pimeloyl-ACP methyl ester carboxylesterase
VFDYPQPRSRFEAVNGLRLHFLEWGSVSSPPMVCLHAAPLNAHAWDEFAGAMAPHFRVICPDVRGFGDSEWAESSDSTMVDDLMPSQRRWGSEDSSSLVTRCAARSRSGTRPSIPMKSNGWYWLTRVRGPVLWLERPRQDLRPRPPYLLDRLPRRKRRPLACLPSLVQSGRPLWLPTTSSEIQAAVGFGSLIHSAL